MDVIFQQSIGICNEKLIIDEFASEGGDIHCLKYKCLGNGKEEGLCNVSTYVRCQNQKFKLKRIRLFSKEISQTVQNDRDFNVFMLRCRPNQDNIAEKCFDQQFL